MTDEEIAEEYAKGLCKTCTFDTCRHSIIQTCAIKESIKQAYKDGAEFGYNKAKEEMQEQGLALQSDMDKTIEQNIALKEQIEKMKCCENCAKNGHICVAEEMQGKLCGKNKVKWQLRR